MVLVVDDLWAAATRHQFIEQVATGSIAADAFDRWLVQDSLFVLDLLTFQARLLARAPRTAQTVLAAGCVALVDELDWFEQQAARRGLDLEAPALAATRDYHDLLARLDTAPFPAAMTGLWVIEEVYRQAWDRAAVSSARSRTAPFAAFIEHWTTPGFNDYVSALGEHAMVAGHEELVAEVLRHEIAFWDLALA
jgi:thiaminase